MINALNVIRHSRQSSRITYVYYMEIASICTFSFCLMCCGVWIWILCFLACSGFLVILFTHSTESERAYTYTYSRTRAQNKHLQTADTFFVYNVHCVCVCVVVEFAGILSKLLNSNETRINIYKHSLPNFGIFE